MKTLRYLLQVLGAMFTCAGIGLAATIHVPGDSATIQAGISGATEGDTVLVADGTYTGDGNHDIDFGGKNVVVASENGPELTIIDCEGQRGFLFKNGEDTGAAVIGFKIANGYDTYAGGAIYCIDASPTIRGNIFDGNYASTRSPGEGGAIYCSGGGPVIEENVFINNIARFGGAIYCLNSSAKITQNIIQDNRGGSGMFSGGYGGGILCDGGNPFITYNTICDNHAGDEYGGYGGGVLCRSVDPAIIINNVFIQNTGNALVLEHSSYAGVMYNTFSHNWSQAIYVQGGSYTHLLNNLIAYNHSSLWALDMDLNMGNNNFYGNEEDSALSEIYDVYFEWRDRIGSDGNCRVNPLFCDTAASDYHISSASFCARENSDCGYLIGALDVGCSGGYVCGDATGDYIVNVGDPVYLISHIFRGGPPPFAAGAGDANCDNETNVGDALYLINYIFKDGPDPLCP